MVSMIKLSSSNYDKLIKLNNEHFSMVTYDKDFVEYYNKQGFLPRILMKKFIRLFYVLNEYVGYMWYEVPIDKRIKILALYIKPEFIDYMDDKVFNSFNNNLLFYETYDDGDNSIVLSKLGFIKVKPTILMKITLDETNLTKLVDLQALNVDVGDINFDIVQSRRSINIRCMLQNSIFNIENRIPVEVEDIENDMEQDYYINNLSIIINYMDIPVGYGQVIYNRGLYTLVNFGIDPQYRGWGLGKLLLLEILKRSQRNNIDVVSLRVDPLNSVAMDLYKKIGFREENYISKWER